MKSVVVFAFFLACGVVFGKSVLDSREQQIVQRLQVMLQNQTLADLYNRTFLSAPRNHVPFDCDILPRSDSVPTSVHALRPGDVDVVAAMGDSLTAARGAKGGVFGLLSDYRGLSWSAGGDGDYNFMTNILKRYNPNLYGYSTGRGDRDSRGAGLNVAKTGDDATDIVEQAELLVARMEADSKVDMQNHWKVITIFIGGNDLCDFCLDRSKFSAKNYHARLEKALDILHEKIPRAFINLVEVLNVDMANELADGLFCSALHIYACNCAAYPRNAAAFQELIDLKDKYQESARELAFMDKYAGRDDWTIVLQPFYRHTRLPRTSDGDVDYSYFAADCFHHSAKGQEAAGISLWNNMVEPVGGKQESWSEDGKAVCPSEAWPYLYTTHNGPTATAA